MNMSVSLKNTINTVMPIFIIIAMSYRITGNIFHEINGIFLVLLFMVHNIFNYKWYKSIGKLKKTPYNNITLAVNIAAAIFVIILIASGVMLSRTIFSFTDEGEGIFIKRIHTFAAYWFFILVSIHIGMHGKRVYNLLPSSVRNNRFTKIAPAAIVIYGIYVSFKRDIGARLIMYFSFDFWDESRLALWFFMENIAVMSLYAIIAFYMSNALKNRNKYMKLKKEPLGNGQE